MQNTGPDREDYSKATVQFVTNKDGEINFSFNYFINDAEWTMSTVGSLDSELENVAIETSANITQNTGENWENIKLNLSNTYTFGGFGSIRQSSDILRLRDPKLEKQMFRRGAMLESAPMMADSAEEIVVTGSKVSTTKSKFDRLYTLSEAVSIASTGEEEIVPISNMDAKAKIITRAAPRHNRTAYVFADARFNNIDSIKDVDATLYRDGHYIGEGRWSNIIANADINLPFGADNQIEITYTEQPPVDGEKGIFSKSNIEEKRYLITVTNHHDTEQTIEIFDKTPVSGHEDIKVKPIKGATTPTEINMDGKQGLQMWRKTLKAGEKWVIKHQYRVTYPTDKLLSHN